MKDCTQPGPDRSPHGAAAIARSLSAVLALVAWLGCGGPKMAMFMHDAHRNAYALRLDELRTVQFYVSEEVLAHELDATGAPMGSDHVLVLPRGTPGLVTDAGADWLRVAFGGGPGVLFAYRPGSRNAWYMLATESEGGQDVRQLVQARDDVLRVGGRRFRIVRGASARLLIDLEDLDRLEKARTHVPGRTLPK